MLFRWMPLAVLAATVTVSGYHRARARRESETIPRSRESGPLIAARLLVGLPLLLAIVTYVVAPARMAWASYSSPAWLRWLGVVLGIAVVPAAHWVLRSLGRNVSETVLTKSQHELVTSGPYRWIRHPLYTTGISLFAAIGLMNASWLILFLVLVIAVLMRIVVIPLEERQLLEKFGDEYRSYMARTGRLVPRL